MAMSGGVDSSVAAALLKERGYDVIGMMLRLWSEPGLEDSNRCCTPESMALARRAAAVLDIPFYVIDAKDIFQRTVVQSFLDGYARGQTPNPCLTCNQQIRWGFLLEHAMSLGAEKMATGHYARLEQNASGSMRLLRAVDRQKDQSYVLHVLNQDQMQRAMFPLGQWLKPEVRKLAEKHGLPTAERRDSQDLCFLAGGDYRDFLRRHAPEMLTPGAIENVEGNIVGDHDGLAAYTIGQRKGLHLHSAIPMYVIRKETMNNRLVVGAREQLGTDSLAAEDVHWLSGVGMSGPFRAEVKTRYTAAEQPAVVTPIEDGRTVHIDFETRQRDITPGQAAVLYVDQEVVGGGIIRQQTKRTL